MHGGSRSPRRRHQSGAGGLVPAVAAERARRARRGRARAACRAARRGLAGRVRARDGHEDEQEAEQHRPTWPAGPGLKPGRSWRRARPVGGARRAARARSRSAPRPWIRTVRAAGHGGAGAERGGGGRARAERGPASRLRGRAGRGPPGRAGAVGGTRRRDARASAGHRLSRTANAARPSSVDPKSPIALVAIALCWRTERRVRAHLNRPLSRAYGVS